MKELKMFDITKVNVTRINIFKDMNWKTIVGILLIIGSAKEMFSIILDYRSGKLNFWPFGADLGCIALIVLGIYLIRKGQKQKNGLF
jgi:hypothetical protein